MEFKHLLCFLLALFMILSMVVIGPPAAFADLSREKALYVGETLSVAHYSNYSSKFSYQWEITSGQDCARIISGVNSVECRIEALMPGKAILKGTATRGRNHEYHHTVTITITEPTFTITFDPNGGRVQEKSIEVTDGSNVGILPTPFKSGCVFQGWFTQKEAGTLIPNNCTINISSDATLYAHWENSSSNGGITVVGDDKKSGQNIDVQTRDRSSTSNKVEITDNIYCKTCGGLGDCPECFGEGYVECPKFCLNGVCSNCDGYGTVVSYVGGKVKERKCIYCDGSGDCSGCDGYGEIVCRYCKGKGSCPSCGGTGLKKP